MHRSVNFFVGISITTASAIRTPRGTTKGTYLVCGFEVQQIASNGSKPNNVVCESTRWTRTITSGCSAVRHKVTRVTPTVGDVLVGSRIFPQTSPKTVPHRCLKTHWLWPPQPTPLFPNPFTPPYTEILSSALLHSSATTAHSPPAPPVHQTSLHIATKPPSRRPTAKKPL